jgi:hypothetical protein
MRPVSLALALSLISAPVLASEDKTKVPEGNYVDVSPVALPIIADGVLVNFVFVQLRLNLTPRADMTRLREKEPYFRDALVRMAYRTPFVRSDSYTKVDEKALTARMMAEAARIAGPGLIANVQIQGEPQAKRVTGLPKPHAAVQDRPPIP